MIKMSTLHLLIALGHLAMQSIEFPSLRDRLFF